MDPFNRNRMLDPTPTPQMEEFRKLSGLEPSRPRLDEAKKAAGKTSVIVLENPKGKPKKGKALIALKGFISFLTQEGFTGKAVLGALPLLGYEYGDEDLYEKVQKAGKLAVTITKIGTPKKTRFKSTILPLTVTWKAGK